MTEDRSDLEARLRDGFRRAELPAAPPTLLDALERVPEALVVRAGSRASRARGLRGSRPWGALGVAAVLLLGGALAIGVGGRPTPTPPPSAAVVDASPSTPPAPTAIRLIFEPQWTVELPSTTDRLEYLVGTVDARINATDLVGFRVTQAQGRIVVDGPVGTHVEPLRRLVGQIGGIAIVPVGATPAEIGIPVEPTLVLVAADSVTDARVVGTETGSRALRLTFDDASAASFSNYTAGHVGEYLALTVDDVVFASPQINEGIRDGVVDISIGSPERDAVELDLLAGIIRLGPLPVALVEVSTGPAASEAPATAAPSASLTPLTTPPPGRIVRTGTVALSADSRLLTIEFTSAAPFAADNPCSGEYVGWAEQLGDTLEVAVVDVTPQPAGPRNCDDIGFVRTVSVNLSRPFLGSRVRDRAGYVHFLRAPDGLVDLSGLPSGWLLRSEGDVEDSPTGRWLRTYSRGDQPALGGSKDRLDFYQSFGGPVDVTGAEKDETAYSVSGRPATLYRYPPAGELVLVWSLGGDGLALVANEADFPVDALIALAESAVRN